MSETQRTITVVLGKPGAGKTYRMERSILPHLPAPRFMIDTQHEFEQGVIYDGSSHPKRHPVAELLALMEQGKAQQYDTHVIRPHPMCDYDTAIQQCTDFLKVADGAGWPGTFVIDEADMFGGPSNAVQPVKNMVFRGRHHAQHLVFTAKRTTTISKNILSAAHCIVSFQQAMKKDIDRLETMFQAGNAVAKLQQYQYCVLGDDAARMPYYDALTSEPEASTP